MKPTLSATVIVKNNEDGLKRLLPTLSFCDEIIVVDDYSVDKTREVARKFEARVYQRRLAGNFAELKNFATQKAKGSWVLSVDSDEEISKRLAREIMNAVCNPSGSVYAIPRVDHWQGKALNHTESANRGIIRLFKKGTGSFTRAVHEYYQTSVPIGELIAPINHYPHPTVRAFVDSISFHATLHAGENRGEGKRVTLFQVFMYPPGKFLYNYFVAGAYKEGIHGFVYSVFMSFHSFIAWATYYTHQE